MTLLSFPTDVSVGTLTIFDPATRQRTTSEARGDVEASPGGTVLLTLDAGAAEAGALRGLRGAYLNALILGADVGDDACAGVPEQLAVDALSIQSPLLTDTGLKHLSRLVGVKQLVVFGEQVTDLSPFAEFALESLMLYAPRVRDLAPVTGSALKSVMVSESDIGDDGLLPLSTCEALRSVMLDAAITDRAFVEIGKAPALTEMNVKAANITDEAASQVFDIGRLTSVGMGSAELLTDACVQSLCSNPLEKLSFDCPNVTDDGARKILGLRSLVSLLLPRAAITPAALSEIDQLERLDTLSIPASAVGPPSIDALSRSTSLTKLNVTDADDRTLLAVRRALPAATVNGVFYSQGALDKIERRLGS